MYFSIDIMYGFQYEHTTYVVAVKICVKVLVYYTQRHAS